MYIAPSFSFIYLQLVWYQGRHWCLGCGNCQLLLYFWSYLYYRWLLPVAAMGCTDWEWLHPRTRCHTGTQTASEVLSYWSQLWPPYLCLILWLQHWWLCMVCFSSFPFKLWYFYFPCEIWKCCMGIRWLLPCKLLISSFKRFLAVPEIFSC